MCSTSLVNKKIQIKIKKHTILKLHILLHTHRMDRFKRWKVPNGGDNDLIYSDTAGGAKHYDHFRKCWTYA